MRERDSTEFNESTLIGNRERVAIEFERTRWPDGYEKWIYGFMCIWVCGQRIGRHDEEVAMTVALTSMPWILNHTGKRADGGLMTMPAKKAFNTMYDAIYRYDEGVSDEELDARSKRYRPFQIHCDGFDYFDGWRAFLIESELAARLIWRAPHKTVHEARIGIGEFDRVLDGFLSELECLSGQTRKF